MASSHMEDAEDKGVSITEVVKKIATAGLGAAFMTEEGVRNYLTGVKLPKEVMGLLVQGANKSKNEMLNMVSTEVINIINKIDFVEEASRFVENHKFKISAEIEVTKK